MPPPIERKKPIHDQFFDWLDGNATAVIFWLGVWFIGVITVVIVVALFSPVHVVSLFEYRDEQVQQCVASDKYTRDECIVLVGGGEK